MAGVNLSLSASCVTAGFVASMITLRRSYIALMPGTIQRHVQRPDAGVGYFHDVARTVDPRGHRPEYLAQVDASISSSTAMAILGEGRGLDRRYQCGLGLSLHPRSYFRTMAISPICRDTGRECGRDRLPRFQVVWTTVSMCASDGLGIVIGAPHCIA